MQAPFELRLGSIAGWIAFMGVVSLLIVIPMALAGQPPTVNSDPASVVAYFRHPELALIHAALAPFVGVALVPFAYGLRSAFQSGVSNASRAFADLGFALVLVTVPVYVLSSALGAALVHAADGDAATFASLFRFYDLLYNAGADVLEGAWIGAFSISILAASAPRWIGWLGVTVMLARWIKAFVPVATVPEIVVSVGGVLFLAWFLAIVVMLTRLARRPVPAASPVGAVAGA
jgi:uncharacterized membrane protein